MKPIKFENFNKVTCFYGARGNGKTYREFEILKTRINELEEENKRLELENEKHKSWVNSLNKDNHKFRDRINKAIEYIENELLPYGDEWYWDDVSIRDYIEKLINILKGGE